MSAAGSTRDDDEIPNEIPACSCRDCGGEIETRSVRSPWGIYFARFCTTPGCVGTGNGGES